MAYVFIPPGLYYFGHIVPFASFPVQMHVKQVGDVYLDDFPLFFSQNNFQMYWDGALGAHNPQQFAVWPTAWIVSNNNIPQVVVSNNNFWLANEEIRNVQGDAAYATGGGTGFRFEQFSVVGNSAQKGCAIRSDGNVISAYVEHFVFNGSAQQTDPGTICFNNLTQSVGTQGWMIRDGWVNNHFVQYDSPANLMGNLCFQNLAMDWVQSESMWDRGILNVDSGSGAQSCAGQGIMIGPNIVQDSNRLGSSGYFTVWCINLVQNTCVSNSVLNNQQSAGNIGYSNSVEAALSTNFNLTQVSTGYHRTSGQGFDVGASGATMPRGGNVTIGTTGIIASNTGGACDSYVSNCVLSAQILPPPQFNGSLSAAAGGSMAAGQYCYEVSSMDASGGESVVGLEKCITVTLNQQVTIPLNDLMGFGASCYRVYRTAVNGGSGNENVYLNTQGACGGSTANAAPAFTTSVLDTGSLTYTSVTPKTSYSNAFMSALNFGSPIWLASGINGNPSIPVGIGTTCTATENGAGKDCLTLGIKTDIKGGLLRAQGGMVTPLNARIGGGDPSIDVTAPPYKADPTGATDSTAAIQAAINAVGATGGTVSIPAGTFALKSATLATGAVSHLQIICDPKAILQAQTGFPASTPMLTISAGSADTLVQGNCIWDGNSIAQDAFQVNTTAQRFTWDGPEIKNTLGNAGQCTLWTGDKIVLKNSFIHNDAGGFYCFVGITTTSTAYVDNNKFDTITSASNPIAAGSSGLNYFEASGNIFSNITPGTNLQAVLYCFGCDKVDWQHNRFMYVTAAVHCDTCGGGNLSWNDAYLDTDTSNFPDYFVEIGSNFTIEGNTSFYKAGERGMILGSGSNVSIQSLRTQVTSFDSTTGFTAGANVALTTDAADKQEGTGSMVATANGSFTTGNLWYFNFGSAQTAWGPYQDFWIKPTSGNIVNGQLQLCLSVNTAISTCDLSVPIPFVAQNSWYRYTLYATGWEAALNINGGSPAGFSSYGIKVTTSSPNLTVKFDDFDKAAELLGYTVRSNKITRPQGGSCITGGALQDPVVSDNYCENPGNAIGYQFASSTAVHFNDNKSNFVTGLTGTVHLLMDATNSASLARVSGDISNAVTLYSSTAGGVVTGVPNSVPAISSGFGTSPSVVTSQGPATFTLNVGGGGTATSGVIAMNATAPNGWACKASDITTHSASVSQTIQTATNTTTATLTQYNNVMVATAWAASDVLQVNCFPY
jgi:hypothetical protein